MKNAALIIVAVTAVAVAVVNVNISIQGNSLSDIQLANIVALAQNENGGSNGYARVGLQDIGQCTDCQGNKEYICGQAQVFCEGVGALTPDEPCGSVVWGGCHPTGNSCR